MKRTILALFILTLAGSAAAQGTAPGPAIAPAPAAAPAPAQKLTGLAAWAKLAGNSVSGKVDGKEHTEYYMDNGTVKSMEGSRVSTGKWILEGANLCFAYAGAAKECYAIEVEGDMATFSSKAHGTYKVNIMKGNPKKL